MSAPPYDLSERTKDFALRIIRLFDSLPATEVARVLGRQLLRSATSVGAHYREAQRAKSGPDFVSKIEGALQELEETRYGIELMMGAEILPAFQLESLFEESTELIAIFITIAKKAKTR